MKQLYCTNCGSPITDGHSFCTNCGTKVITQKAFDGLAARDKSKAETANERDRLEAKEKILRSFTQSVETVERIPKSKEPAAEIRIIPKEFVPTKEEEAFPITPPRADNTTQAEPDEEILPIPQTEEPDRVAEEEMQTDEEPPETSFPEEDQDEEAEEEEPKVQLSKGRKVLLALLIPLNIILLVIVLLMSFNILEIGSFIKYRRAESLMDEGEYEKAIGLLSELNDYKDSASMISEMKYRLANSLMDEGNYQEAISLLSELNGYKDSASMIPEMKYRLASFLMSEGRYEEAYATFNEISYEDSLEKASECLFLLKKSHLSGIKKGDTVRFGFYEQDNDTTNGKEEIEWIVLDVEGSKALVISKYALDRQPYNASNIPVTWQQCTLRKWLNDSFLNTAFTAKHQELIPSVSVSADKNPNFGTNPGNATTDKVFLLSIAEAEYYFTTDESRKSAPTAYAKVQGAYMNDNIKTASGEATDCWWLRSPGSTQNRAAIVHYSGSASVFSYIVDSSIVAVRPALWLNLDS